MSPEEPTLPRRSARLSCAGVLSILTTLVAVGTVTLHVLGVASHRAYLQYWGIDADVFPKSTDWVLINGYHGLMNQSAVALLGILANFGWWAAAAVGVALYLFILLSPWDAGSGAVFKWLSQRPASVQRFAKILAATLLIAAIIPVVLVAWTAVMVMPYVLGEANGKAHATREALEFKKGCEHSKQPCVELKRGGETLGSGFFLDGSASHIAIFDAQLQRARVVPRDAVELISGRTPALPEVIAP
ncbi:hypothetical protein RA8P1_00239 (plasmid) [Variovorax sp. RA8]|nr:hypothetical protein RA8P1_00239 [Variovorax sp. RA8]